MLLLSFLSALEDDKEGVDDREDECSSFSKLIFGEDLFELFDSGDADWDDEITEEDEEEEEDDNTRMPLI